MTGDGNQRGQERRRPGARDRRQRPGPAPGGVERRVQRARRRQIGRLADVGTLSHAELLRRWSTVVMELGSIRQWQLEALEKLGQAASHAEMEQMQAEHEQLDLRCASLHRLAINLAKRVEELVEKMD